MTKKIVFLLFTFLPILLSCSKNTDPIVNFEITHFEFVLYDGLTSVDVWEIGQALEQNHPRILNDLQVENMPIVTAKIWADYNHFLIDMENDIGIRYSGATGYIFGMTEFRMFYNPQATITAVHEFAHLVSMQINSTIPNNPRWLWEAVALYENNEFVDPRILPYMVSGNYPTLEDLNTDYNSGNQRIYSVGYVLLEYIVEIWGMNEVINLIRSNGNINLVLGITVTEFENGWYQYLEATYLH